MIFKMHLVIKKNKNNMLILINYLELNKYNINGKLNKYLNKDPYS